MVDTVILVLLIALFLLFLTGLDSRFPLPTFTPSSENGRMLLHALEDLVLPLGSFPTNLLHPWGRDSELHTPLTDRSSKIVDEEGSNDKPTDGLVSPSPTIPSSELTFCKAELSTMTTSPPEMPSSDKDQLSTTSDDFPISFFDAVDYQQDVSITLAVDAVPSESKDFENAIRKLVDSEGVVGSDTTTLVHLVEVTIKRRISAEKSLKIKTSRFLERTEDQRLTHQKARKALKLIIRKRNERARLIDSENINLIDSNRKLQHANEALEQRRQRKKGEYNQALKRLNSEKNAAENDAQEAEAKVDERIKAVEEEYKTQRSAAEEKSWQEKNSLICGRAMVEDELREVRSQLTAANEQHAAEGKAKAGVIKELNASLRQAKLTETTRDQVAAADKQRLEERLRGRIEEKNTEIESLKGKLRGSEDAAKKLGDSAVSAQAVQNKLDLLSASWKEKETTLREDKQHAVGNLKRDITGLKRSIRESETELRRLTRKIASLETGKELQSLKSQIEELKQQLQSSLEEVQVAKKELLEQQAEAVKLRRNIKAKKAKMSAEVKQASEDIAELKTQLAEDASKREEGIRKQEQEKASNERAELKKVLEEVARKSEDRLKEDAHKLLQQNEELSRKLEQAQSAEEAANNRMKLLEDAKTQTATEHQDLTKQKDGQISALQRAAHDADEEVKKANTSLESLKNERTRSATEHSNAIKLKDQRIIALELAAQKMMDVKSQTAADQKDTIKQKAEEMSALKRAAQSTKDEASKIETDLPAEMSALQPRVAGIAVADSFGREIRKPKSPRKRPIQPSSRAPLTSPSTTGQAVSSTDQTLQKNVIPGPETTRQVPVLEQAVQPQAQQITSRDNRRSFAEIMAAVKQPVSTVRANIAGVPASAPEGSNTAAKRPAEEAQLPLHGLKSEDEVLSSSSPRPIDHDCSPPPFSRPIESENSPPLFPRSPIENESSPLPFPRPIRSIRARRRPNASSPGPTHDQRSDPTQDQRSSPTHDQRSGPQGSSASLREQDSDQPNGWTEAMTKEAKEMFLLKDQIEMVEEVIKEVYGLQVDDGGARLVKWLEKMRSQIEDEENQTQPI